MDISLEGACTVFGLQGNVRQVITPQFFEFIFPGAGHDKMSTVLSNVAYQLYLKFITSDKQLLDVVQQN